jgi:hypothetical protein
MLIIFYFKKLSYIIINLKVKKIKIIEDNS